MRYIIFITYFFLLGGYAQGQITFINYYSDNGADLGQGIIQLEDSSYIITGSSSSFGEAPAQAFLMQIDSLGNYMWSKSYGGVGSESGRRVLYKEGFGYYVCGYTNSFGAGGFDFYLAKIDESADLEWEKSFGGSGWERVNDAAITRDTGTVMVGETSSNATDNMDIYIVRTDKLGDTVWTKTIGAAGDDRANCIFQFTDSTYLIGGEYFVDSALTKGYMTYLHEDGTVYWESIFGVNGNYWVNDIVLDIDPTKVVGIGGGEGPLTNENDAYLFLMQTDGTYWGGYHPSLNGQLEFTQATNFGSIGDVYIAASLINDTGFEFGEDVTINKYNSSLGFEGSFGMSHNYPDVTGDIIRTSDGGAIVVGYSTGVVSGGNEITVAKIGPGDSYPDISSGGVSHNVVVVDELDFEDLISVYPNPSSGLFNVYAEKNVFSEFNVIDNQGRLIKSGDFNNEMIFDLSNEPRGVYFIKLMGTKVSPVQLKVLIQE